MRRAMQQRRSVAYGREMAGPSSQPETSRTSGTEYGMNRHNPAAWMELVFLEEAEAGTGRMWTVTGQVAISIREGQPSGSD